MAVDQLAEKISATGLKVMKKSFACSYANSIVFFYLVFYLFVVLVVLISGHNFSFVPVSL